MSCERATNRLGLVVLNRLCLDRCAIWRAALMSLLSAAISSEWMEDLLSRRKSEKGEKGNWGELITPHPLSIGRPNNGPARVAARERDRETTTGKKRATDKELNFPSPRPGP